MDYGRRFLELKGLLSNPKRLTCEAQNFSLHILADGFRGLKHMAKHASKISSSHYKYCQMHKWHNYYAHFLPISSKMFEVRINAMVTNIE